LFYDSMAVIATRTGGNDVVNVPEEQSAKPGVSEFQRFNVSVCRNTVVRPLKR